MIAEAPRRKIDITLLASVMALLVIGAAMVYSASFVVAHNEFGDDMYFFGRHLVYAAIGLVAMGITARADYHLWQRLAFPLFALSLLLLLLVLLPAFGTTTYGASRWFRVGSVLSMQPSELAKLAVVVYLASWITRVGRDIGKMTFGTMQFGIIIAIPAGLILIEPDLGTTIVLVMTAASVFFVAGANLLHGLTAVVAGSFFMVNYVINSGYKADRISAWVNPWADMSGVGWHTVQTLIALGSGGIQGLGLGAGRQKYAFLPNAHTDGIFAILGEELGFIGAVLVLTLFLVLAWRGLLIAASARDPFGRVLATGSCLVLVWQALLNMAVVSHVVPNTGVPLPFLSFGGTSMIVSLTFVGILLSISRTAEPSTLSLKGLLVGSSSSPAPEPVPAAEPRRFGFRVPSPRAPRPAPRAASGAKPVRRRMSPAERPS
jgi:cell division protein FtsW